MNHQTYPPSISARESEIESLARETNTPLETVREIYRVERDKLERSARVKTFVSVLAQRRVKALLQVERGKRH
jgi:N-glycosylase/DNA lyase